ncbi:MAG: DUF1801 domain-containing protein [Bacteroidales bacterium]|nr:DUF1801 domain-containing protein [Bacteroidales bacterium]MCF8402822.1 DUF1801 domain-containing protein [Bacteroidales bacterium]
MTDVESYIYGFEGTQREILIYLHHYFIDELNLICKMRYKIPFYDQKSWICYLNAIKNGHVELGFPRGNELSNEQGILIVKDRKMVRSLIFENVKTIPFQPLTEIMHEALLLDQVKPYSFKNRN